MSVQAINLGFPRVGVRRELTKTTDGYRKGTTTQESLLQAADEQRTVGAGLRASL
jgi:hypothetical protein